MPSDEILPKNPDRVRRVELARSLRDASHIRRAFPDHFGRFARDDDGGLSFIVSDTHRRHQPGAPARHTTLERSVCADCRLRTSLPRRWTRPIAARFLPLVQPFATLVLVCSIQRWGQPSFFQALTRTHPPGRPTPDWTVGKANRLPSLRNLAAQLERNLWGRGGSRKPWPAVVIHLNFAGPSALEPPPHTRQRALSPGGAWFRTTTDPWTRRSPRAPPPWATPVPTHTAR